MKNGNIEFETIKTHKNRLYFLCGFVCVVVLLIMFIVSKSHAKYRVTESIPLVNGTINYTLPDLNVVGLYIDGVEATELDSSKSYTLDTTQSTCTYKDGTEITDLSISYDSDTGKLTITPFTTKGTKCTLYFEEYKIPAKDIILASKTISTRTDFSTTLTTDTTGTIYSAEDDDGTTYYFAGAPTDNWVSFAGFYWRIIRINGDGTIRIIYAGTDPTVTTGTGTQTGGSTYSINSSTYNNNAYVGYMYTIGQVHGLGKNSGIKTTLDSWYSNNINNTSYADDIDTNAGFCGDRTSTTTDGGAPDDTGGTGTTETYYGARYRLYTNKTPTFKCSDKANDLYTKSVASQGNKALTYPIGLITADEVAYAGGVDTTNNTSYYLYTNQYYWTMSPSYFDGSYAHVFLVGWDGYIYWGLVYSAGGVRPVINLRADIELTGSGTATDPYEVIST